jgi:hypothetical protein
VGDVELGLAKGRREKDSRMIIPGGRTTPMHGPKVRVIRGMHFLETDHVRRVITEKPEKKGAFVRVGYTLDI